MKQLPIGAQGVKVSLVPDDEYRRIAKLLCSRARHRIYASIFIIDIGPKGLEPSIVIELLKEISDANRRGVKVKVAIGGSSDNIRIQQTGEAAYFYCKQLHIPCKVIARKPNRSSHKKVIVIDDYVLLGSHNWSTGAFSGEIQDSILIADARIARFLVKQLEHEWSALN
jgi:phosphatidylserine/phosphatidylglycerophosphate/cardiolipin synthase-like enzyme